MTVAPLQLPGPLIVPQLDFSPLDKIGDAYVKHQERQREAEALAGLVESIPIRGVAPPSPTVMPSAPRSSTPNYSKTSYTSPSALSREAAAVNSGTWQPASDYGEGLKLAQASLNNPP